jgi:hypothetical protein
MAAHTATCDDSSSMPDEHTRHLGRWMPNCRNTAAACVAMLQCSCRGLGPRGQASLSTACYIAVGVAPACAKAPKPPAAGADRARLQRLWKRPGSQVKEKILQSDGAAGQEAEAWLYRTGEKGRRAPTCTLPIRRIHIHRTHHAPGSER